MGHYNDILQTKNYPATYPTW